MIRENEMVENYRSLSENNARLAADEMKKINESESEKEKFINNYYQIKESAHRKKVEEAALIENARNNGFADCLKAIYITALEAYTLSDEGILLAESMVDNYIKENGGASKILSKVGNDSYLLSRITDIVENYALNEVDDILNEGFEVTLPKNPFKVKSILDVGINKFLDKFDNLTEDEIINDLKNNKNTLFSISSTIINNKEHIKFIPRKKTIDSADDIYSLLSIEMLVDLNKYEDKNVGAKKFSNLLDQLNDINYNNTNKAKAIIWGIIGSITAATVGISLFACNKMKKKREQEKIKKSLEKANESYLFEGELQDKALIVAKNYIDNASDKDLEKFIGNIKDEDLELPEEDDDSEKSDKEEDKDSLDMSFDDDDEGSDKEKDKEKKDKSKDTDVKESDEDVDLNDDEVDPDEDALEDDDINDALGKPLDSDEDSTDITVDGDTDNKGEMFKQLDKEEDVQKAIDTIRSRVADAEETFIKNNAEDKKKIDEILNRISTNVKTVQDLNDDNKTESKVAQEAVMMDKRRIDGIRYNRPLTIFEKMTRNLTLNIVKDCAVRESYIEEHGQLDMNHIVETAKIMYGFMETVNTLQLEKVDEAYIKNVLENMH
jgi:hypothetical protein